MTKGIVLAAAFLMASMLTVVKADSASSQPAPVSNGVDGQAQEAASPVSFYTLNYSDKKIPILAFHSVSDKTYPEGKEWSVHIKDFAGYLDHLKAHRYHPITFRDLPNVEAYSNPIIITFDDGYADNRKHAYPLLKEHGFRAVIFVTTGYLGKDNYLTQRDVKRMTDLIDFEGHTVTHPGLTDLTSEAIEKELSDSNSVIESLTGRQPIAFAYPFGDHDERVVRVVKNYYQYAVTFDAVVNDLHVRAFEGLENYVIPRIYVPRNMKRKEFAKVLQAPEKK